MTYVGYATTLKHKKIGRFLICFLMGFLGWGWDEIENKNYLHSAPTNSLIWRAGWRSSETVSPWIRL